MSFEDWLCRVVIDLDVAQLTAVEIDLANQGISDSTAVGLAGTTTEISKAARSTVFRLDSRQEGAATVWGTNSFASIADAAFLNGVSAHALDWDDHSQPMCGHCSTVLAPVVLAVGESLNADGMAVIAAYLAGYEVNSIIGALATLEHYSRGWHATSTIGSVGAAMAAGKLLGLDGPALRSAMAIAVSTSCGVRANFGTMTKPLHAGFAARAGVQAALMARAGVGGSSAPLTGQFGFFDLFALPGPDIEALIANYRSDGRLYIEREMGLVHKPYPCCGSSHPSIDAAIDIAKNDRITNAESVDRIVCAVPSFVDSILVYPNPTDEFEARYSLTYPVVAALANGKLGPSEFDFDKMDMELVRALIAKTSVEFLEVSKPDEMFAGEVAVHMKDGRKLNRRVNFGLGHPRNPMELPQRQEKQRQAIGMARGQSEAALIVERLSDISSYRDIVQLTANLR